jgi:hypothetical protein
MAKDSKSDLSKLPEKYPKRVTEGKSMDYQDANLMFPKPSGKKKGKKWGK